MTATWLLVALMQGASAPASQSEAPTVRLERARLTVGGNLSGMGVAFQGGGFFGGAAGADVSVAVSSRGNVDLRVARLYPGSEGFYELRYRHAIGSRDGSTRKYLSVGGAGFIYRRHVGPSSRYVGGLDATRPRMVSMAFGAERAAGKHFIVPLEGSLTVHPQGLLVFGVTTGLKWSPRSMTAR